MSPLPSLSLSYFSREERTDSLSSSLGSSNSDENGDDTTLVNLQELPILSFLFQHFFFKVRSFLHLSSIYLPIYLSLPAPSYHHYRTTDPIFLFQKKKNANSFPSSVIPSTPAAAYPRSSRKASYPSTKPCTALTSLLLCISAAAAASPASCSSTCMQL